MTTYNKLNQKCDSELTELIHKLTKEKNQLESENQYYEDFIYEMHLYYEFQEFRKSAHKELDVFGFPYYTMMVIRKESE